MLLPLFNQNKFWSPVEIPKTIKSFLVGAYNSDQYTQIQATINYFEKENPKIKENLLDSFDFIQHELISQEKAIVCVDIPMPCSLTYRNKIILPED